MFAGFGHRSTLSLARSESEKERERERERESHTQRVTHREADDSQHKAEIVLFSYKNDTKG